MIVGGYHNIVLKGHSIRTFENYCSKRNSAGLACSSLFSALLSSITILLITHLCHGDDIGCLSMLDRCH